MLHVGAAGQFGYYTAIFFMHCLISNKIGQNFSIYTNGGGCFVAGRFYGEDGYSFQVSDTFSCCGLRVYFVAGCVRKDTNQLIQLTRNSQPVTFLPKLYLVLIATTGSIFAAMEAGIIPEMIPSIIHMDKASMIILGAINIGNGSTALNTNESSQTRPRPTSPPMIHKKALSMRNSVSMVLRFAPSAFFQSDLAGSFSYCNEHNIGHTKSPHNQAKTCNGPATCTYLAKKSFYLLAEHSHIITGKIVFIRWA